MPEQIFEQFISSGDTLWVYSKRRLIFSSKKELLTPLLEYIDAFVPKVKGVRVFDRVVGNATALLLEKASCREIYSPLGSRYAALTLEDKGIRYHFRKTVPHILNEKGDDICPMEKLSLDKSSDEFIAILRKKQKA